MSETKEGKKMFFRISKLLFLILLLVKPVTAQANVTGTYLYNLSNFEGVIPYYWCRVVTDRETNEVYVLYQNNITIFNEHGMEVYRFGDDVDIGQCVDIAVDPDGSILLLSYRNSTSTVFRCNYRGDPKSEMKLQNLPADFPMFFPNRVVCRKNYLYFISLMDMRVLVTDMTGNYKDSYDLFKLCGLEEKDRQDKEIIGFTVDRDGNLFFTIPALFKVYKVSPDRQVSSFGKSGGAPGRFGVIAGIAVDEQGNILITDKLKCIVHVFDKDFKFINEFGYRGGLGPGNLASPDDIAVDGRGRIYISQSRKRGVSVFNLTYE